MAEDDNAYLIGNMMVQFDDEEQELSESLDLTAIQPSHLDVNIDQIDPSIFIHSDEEDRGRLGEEEESLTTYDSSDGFCSQTQNQYGIQGLSHPSFVGYSPYPVYRPTVPIHYPYPFIPYGLAHHPTQINFTQAHYQQMVFGHLFHPELTIQSNILSNSTPNSGKLTTTIAIEDSLSPVAESSDASSDLVPNSSPSVSGIKHFSSNGYHISPPGYNHYHTSRVMRADSGFYENILDESNDLNFSNDIILSNAQENICAQKTSVSSTVSDRRMVQSCYSHTTGQRLDDEKEDDGSDVFVKEEDENIDESMGRLRPNNFRKCKSLFEKCESLGSKSNGSNQPTSERIASSDSVKSPGVRTPPELLQCTVCDYSSHNKSNFRNHLFIHSEERLFACSLCSYKGKQSAGLRAHLKVHSLEKPYRCIYCSYRCKRKQNLVQHLRIHSKHRPFQCHFCSYGTTTKQALQKHSCRHLSPSPCKEEMENSSSLPDLSDTSSQTKCDDRTLDNVSDVGINPSKGEGWLKDYISKELNNEGNSKASIEENEVTSTQEGNVVKPKTKFYCSFCPFTSSRKCAMGNHIKTHDKDNFNCPVCSFKCKVIANFRSHLDSHVKISKLKCSICDFEVDDSEIFILHLKSHKNRFTREKMSSEEHYNNKYYHCPYCQYDCHILSILKLHINSHSEKDFRGFQRLNDNTLQDPNCHIGSSGTTAAQKSSTCQDIVTTSSATSAIDKPKRIFHRLPNGRFKSISDRKKTHPNPFRKIGKTAQRVRKREKLCSKDEGDLVMSGSKQPGRGIKRTGEGEHLKSKKKTMKRKPEQDINTTKCKSKKLSESSDCALFDAQTSGLQDSTEYQYSTFKVNNCGSLLQMSSLLTFYEMTANVEVPSDIEVDSLGHLHSSGGNKINQIITNEYCSQEYFDSAESINAVEHDGPTNSENLTISDWNRDNGGSSMKNSTQLVVNSEIVTVTTKFGEKSCEFNKNEKELGTSLNGNYCLGCHVDNAVLLQDTGEMQNLILESVKPVTNCGNCCDQNLDYSENKELDYAKSDTSCREDSLNIVSLEGDQENFGGRLPNMPPERENIHCGSKSYKCELGDTIETAVMNEYCDSNVKLVAIEEENINNNSVAEKSGCERNEETNDNSTTQYGLSENCGTEIPSNVNDEDKVGANIALNSKSIEDAGIQIENIKMNTSCNSMNNSELTIQNCDKNGINALSFHVAEGEELSETGESKFETEETHIDAIQKSTDQVLDFVRDEAAKSEDGHNFMHDDAKNEDSNKDFVPANPSEISFMKVEKQMCSQYLSELENSELVETPIISILEKCLTIGYNPYSEDSNQNFSKGSGNDKNNFGEDQVISLEKTCTFVSSGTESFDPITSSQIDSNGHYLITDISSSLRSNYNSSTSYMKPICSVMPSIATHLGKSDDLSNEGMCFYGNTNTSTSFPENDDSCNITSIASEANPKGFECLPISENYQNGFQYPSQFESHFDDLKESVNIQNSLETPGSYSFNSTALPSFEECSPFIDNYGDLQSLQMPSNNVADRQDNSLKLSEQYVERYDVAEMDVMAVPMDDNSGMSMMELVHSKFDYANLNKFSNSISHHSFNSSLFGSNLSFNKKVESFEHSTNNILVSGEWVKPQDLKMFCELPPVYKLNKESKSNADIYKMPSTFVKLKKLEDIGHGSNVKFHCSKLMDLNSFKKPLKSYETESSLHNSSNNVSDSVITIPDDEDYVKFTSTKNGFALKESEAIKEPNGESPVNKRISCGSAQDDSHSSGNTVTPDITIECNPENIGECKYSCDICTRAFFKKSALASHLRSHKESSLKMQLRRPRNHAKSHYTCMHCDFSSVRKCSVLLHERIHKNERKCPECAFTCTLQADLETHAIRHKKETYDCSVCGFTSNYSQVLYDHKNSVHKKRYFCTECSFKSYTIGELTDHISVHKKVLLKCKKCNYETNSTLFLKFHMKKHIKDAKFLKCKECQYVASSKLDLCNHLAQHSTQNYQCVFCDQIFFEATEFKNHLLKIHSIETLNE